MADGFFLGGVAAGIGSGREQEINKRKQDLAEKTAAEELDLKRRALGQSAKGLSLQEAELLFRQEQAASADKRDNKKLSLEERRIGLEESKLKAEEGRDLVKRADESIKELMTVISETAKVSLEAGHPPEKVAATVKPLLDNVMAIASGVDRDPNRYVSQVQAMIARPNAMDKAAAEGATGATRRVAEAQVLEAAGVGSTEAQETAGIKQPKEAKNVELRTFMVDNKLVSVPADDRQAIDDIIARGGVATPVSVQAAGVGDLNMTTKPDQKTVTEARKSVRDTLDRIQSLKSVQEKFRDNPAAGGVSGLVIENLSGLVKQVPIVGKRLTEAAEKQLGYDPKEITKARTEARLSIGQILTLVSQDTRYSDQDRKLAEATLRALEATADEDSIESSFQTVIDMMDRQMMSDVDELRVAAGLSTSKLATNEGLEKLGEILMSNGFTDEQAAEAAAKLIKRLGIQVPAAESGRRMPEATATPVREPR